MRWSQGMIVRVAGRPEGEGLCGVGRGDCRVKKGPRGVMCSALKVTLTCYNNNNADARDGGIRAECRERKCNGAFPEGYPHSRRKYISRRQADSISGPAILRRGRKRCLPASGKPQQAEPGRASLLWLLPTPHASTPQDRCWARTPSAYVGCSRQAAFPSMNREGFYSLLLSLNATSINLRAPAFAWSMSSFGLERTKRQVCA
jgi:hypothetical protein